jgi:general secretion pathway protein D
MPRRVLIEILVAEFTLDDSTALGIEWSLRPSAGSGSEASAWGSAAGSTPAPGHRAPPADVLLRPSEPGHPDPAPGLREGEPGQRAVDPARAGSSENKRAQIHVGRSVPILTTQQQPTTGIASQTQPTSVITTTVEYRDTGIILTVTPRVSDNRVVALDVRQEVSDAVPNVISGTQSPVITKRVAETSVVVGENKTLGLGGLIEERKVQDREGIPFLSRIPILGYLFGTTTEITRKTELVIPTPRVILDRPRPRPSTRSSSAAPGSGGRSRTRTGRSRRPVPAGPAQPRPHRPELSSR